MARVLDLVGERLIALPGGEIGDRSARCPSGDRSQWVAGPAGKLSRQSSLFDLIDGGTMNEQGFPVDFESTMRLPPRSNPVRLGAQLRLGYDTAALGSWADCERLRSAAGLPTLRLQVGLPTGFGIAVSVLGPIRALRYARAFVDCLAREAADIVRSVSAENVMFQVEAPAEVIAAHRVPRSAVGPAVRSVIALARRIPSQVPVGVHLCHGDLNNVASIAPDNFDRLVLFAQELLRRCRHLAEHPSAPG